MGSLRPPLHDTQQSMKPEDAPIRGEQVAWQRARQSTERRSRKALWVILVVAAVGVAVAITDLFATGATPSAGGSANVYPTGLFTVVRQDLSSQTQVQATLGYAGSYTIAAPSGTSPQQIAQEQQTVSADRQTLSSDEQTESDQSAADSQQIAAGRSSVDNDESTLRSDEVAESQVCTGSGASTPACSSDQQRVVSDQAQLSQADQQLESAQSAATLARDQDQAKVESDESRLQEDQATLAYAKTGETGPGTTYTWLPSVGAVISEDESVYALSNEPVPLLYGSTPAWRAFYVGMSDGADVGELTEDLIVLGYGAGLSRSDHYSSTTAAAVERWQSGIGLMPTGEILLGQVIFEPGPIRVTSVAPSLGQSVGGGVAGAGDDGGDSDGGNGDGAASGGGSVLTATSTARQVSIALDAELQSEVADGDQVTITLPDNETTPGVISSVGTVAITPSSSSDSGSGSSSGPTITVLVKPTDPAATGDWDQAPVDVTITTAKVPDALVVPIDALVAQSGGGYAVEVESATGLYHLESVSVGLYDDADGLVQVSGPGLTARQQVVVPKL